MRMVEGGSEAHGAAVVIVMCTHNGVAFLHDQLNSFLAQADVGRGRRRATRSTTTSSRCAGQAEGSGESRPARRSAPPARRRLRQRCRTATDRDGWRSCRVRQRIWSIHGRAITCPTFGPRAEIDAAQTGGWWNGASRAWHSGSSFWLKLTRPRDRALRRVRSGRV
jgi:hypothetical protein